MFTGCLVVYGTFEIIANEDKFIIPPPKNNVTPWNTLYNIC